MPHKHRRRGKDESHFDLPPTTIARPLPVRESRDKDRQGRKNKKDNSTTELKQNGNPKEKKPTVRQAPAFEDDTPRAFARLMAFQKMGKKAPGPDDSSASIASAGPNGNIGQKKRKRGETELKNETRPEKNSKQYTTNASPSIPKILPGEKLSDFAARVDQAMPVSGLKRSQRSTAKSSLDLPMIREQRVTKHEKRLRRLQQQWREEELRIREREEEEREENEAAHEEQLGLWREWDREAGRVKSKSKKASKKRKGSRGVHSDAQETGSEDDDEDPWAKLNSKARHSRSSNPLEVAKAPPELTKPREIFKLKGGARVDVANVPATAGSLRRREELAEERKLFLENYRKGM